MTTAKAVASKQDELALRREIEALGPWFQNLTIGGVQTAPDHFLGDYPAFKFARFADALPRDLSGKSVLDIGCNAGFYAIEMKRRGAAEVVGIDSDERYLAQARFAADALGFPDIRFEQLSVYDVGRLGRRFDLVISNHVLEHLFDSSPDDLHESHDQETCCGAHGLYPKIDPAGSAECAKTLVEQVEREHGEALVCGSSQCSRHIREKGGDEHFTIDLIEAACLAYEIELSES